MDCIFAPVWQSNQFGKPEESETTSWVQAHAIDATGKQIMAGSANASGVKYGMKYL
jgi:hypothetical protein